MELLEESSRLLAPSAPGAHGTGDHECYSLTGISHTYSFSMSVLYNL